MRNRLPGISLRPVISRQLGVALMLLHAAAAGAILMIPGPLNIKLVLLLLLLLHGFRSHRHFMTRHAKRIVLAQVGGDGSVLLLWGDGRESRAMLRADTLLTPWVIVLRFDTAHRLPVSLVLCPDAIPRAENRRLRTLLRFVLLDQKGL